MKTSLKTTACLLMLTSTGINQAMAKSYTNFIIILMDDMGYGDLRSNGAIGYDMPNTEKMQREGMTFTHYYAPQAVSGASRAGLLTGCYPNRIGLSGAPFPGSPTGIHDQETTIAEMLKQKGYTCAAFGKWHLGDQKEFLPLRHGFDEFYGIPYSNDMWPGHPTLKFPDLPLIEGENTIAHNPDQSCFTTDFTQRAVKFIQKNRKKPFFLYLAHPMPHVPLFVSDKFKGKSSCGLYGDVLMELDWSIGEILNTLKKEKLDKNTLVIVISDNGPWLNYGNHAGNTGGLREGKGASFEGGQRVPCIMRWKGHVPEGSLCNKLASGIDILATFAEIFMAVTTVQAEKNEKAAKALTERLIPTVVDHFIFQKIDSDNGKDVFEIESVDGKIHIRGNSANSMATGLNHYLKYCCKTTVSMHDLH